MDGINRIFKKSICKSGVKINVEIVCIYFAVFAPLREKFNAKAQRPQSREV